MTNYQGLSASKMAGRILAREDNSCKKEIIKNTLDMYADEIYKAMLNGERVQISGVGTIIPEIKTHVGSYNMPICNKSNENGNPPPYTKIKISRNWSIKEAMDRQLFKNIENGILGLKKLPFDVQQINILKKADLLWMIRKEEMLIIIKRWYYSLKCRSICHCRASKINCKPASVYMLCWLIIRRTNA